MRAGGVDAVVANAGVMASGRVEDMDLDELRRVIEVVGLAQPWFVASVMAAEMLDSPAGEVLYRRVLRLVPPVWVEAVGRDLADAVARRSRHVVIPRRLAPVTAMPGLFIPLVERCLVPPGIVSEALRLSERSLASLPLPRVQQRERPTPGRLSDMESRGILNCFQLDGRVAVVTGASSGLGVAFAQAFAEAGADVALGARRADRLQATSSLVEEAGRKAIAVATDVSRPEDCQNLVQKAVEAFGRVDILVNNAGVGTAVPATRETPEQFRKVIDVNLSGCYWMAQACARAMQPGSSIINISSVLGLTTAGLPQAAYAASKAGLIGLTRDLAQQWTGRKGIRVNALAPGFFPSEMTDQFPEGYLEGQLNRVVVGRPGRPEELAAAAVFLAGDGAGYITGQTLAVDGGLTIA